MSANNVKKTQEEIIKEFIEVHGHDFDYKDVVYVNINTPVTVLCKKHNYTFRPTPKNHKNGSKCYFCGREAQIEKAKKSEDVFKKEVNGLFDYRYNLDLVEYKNNKTPVIIICEHHGEIKKKPSDILTGIACDRCDRKKTKSTDKKLFIEEAIKVYGDKDDYTNTKIISSKQDISILCKKHNKTFTKSIQNYLSGHGCPDCSAENYKKLRSLPKDEYYKRVYKKYGNKYKYLDNYTYLSEPITFICEKHGVITRNAENHLKGYECPFCEKEPHKLNRMTKEGYCKLAKGRVTFLYLIKCTKNEEVFYKIGKTFQNISKRFTKNNIPYDVDIVYTYESSAENIWDLEESMHEKYKSYSYKPTFYFRGYTECYDLSLPIEEIWKTL